MTDLSPRLCWLATHCTPSIVALSNNVIATIYNSGLNWNTNNNLPARARCSSTTGVVTRPHGYSAGSFSHTVRPAHDSTYRTWLLEIKATNYEQWYMYHRYNAESYACIHMYVCVYCRSIYLRHGCHVHCHLCLHREVHCSPMRHARKSLGVMCQFHCKYAITLSWQNWTCESNKYYLSIT